MYYLVYISYANIPFEDADLQTLLDKCVENNSKLGLTGLLLYCNQKFMQVLEGEEEVVKSIFDKIRKDPRHRNVGMIIDGKLKKRNYSDWSMAYKSMSGEDMHDKIGFHDIEEYFHFNKPTEESHVTTIFMKLFFDKNHKNVLDINQ